MKKTILTILVLASAAAAARAQWCGWGRYPYRPYCYGARPFYGGYGYGGCGDTAAIIAGIFTAGRVLETAMVTRAQPRTIVVQQPVAAAPRVVYSAATAPARAAIEVPAIPFGFVDRGALRSPWSQFELSPGAWRPGQIYHDANNGRQFVAPGGA